MRDDGHVKIVALAGGVGAGKFLRGLIGVMPGEEITVVVNTGDDITVHGLHVSPDLDSVTYWLAGVADRERGWGRAGETFRATEEMGRLGVEGSWFGLGDLDLATHVLRTRLLEQGRPLSEVTEEIANRFGVTVRVVPMTDDPVVTRVEVNDGSGWTLDLHFQEYWVQRGARDEVKGLRYDGAKEARPAPGVIEALADAEVVVICPSNPIASIDPILAVPGVAEAVAARRRRVAGVSPIVGGAPLRGMADRLLQAAGVEVSAAGVGAYYAERGLISAWVIDETDRALASRIERGGVRVSVTDTIMGDDAASERLAAATVQAALAEVEG